MVLTPPLGFDKFHLPGPSLDPPSGDFPGSLRVLVGLLNFGLFYEEVRHPVDSCAVLDGRVQTDGL